MDRAFGIGWNGHWMEWMDGMDRTSGIRWIGPLEWDGSLEWDGKDVGMGWIGIWNKIDRTSD